MLLDLVRTVAPAETPVSLARCKAHLRVEHVDEDAKIQGYLDGAVSRLDGYSGTLGRAMMAQTWVLYLACFPARCIRLPLPPLLSVELITYTDTAGAEQTVDEAVYQVIDGPVSEVRLAYDQNWPTDVRNHPRSIAVTFRCGWANAAEVPAVAHDAILLMVQGAYEQTVDENRDKAIQRLLKALKKPRV